ncbi:MAG: ferritin family protein [Bacteroidales bacterium]|jgi:rubrerythrin|nr:ferritin family protein [Bacteroidales bacterium]
MKAFNNIDEILDFAIGEEQAAVDFYLMLAERSKTRQSRKAFTDFAEEEMRHKAKLLKVKETGSFQISGNKVKDLKITEYLVDVRPSPDMSYQDALILAMKKEKAAFRMYSELAENAINPGVRDIFLNLAQEESRHKLRFEIEYDDYILREN